MRFFYIPTYLTEQLLNENNIYKNIENIEQVQVCM